MEKWSCQCGKAALSIWKSGLANTEKRPCQYGKASSETSEAITATVNRNCKSHRKLSATHSPAMVFQHPIMTLENAKSLYS